MNTTTRLALLHRLRERTPARIWQAWEADALFSQMWAAERLPHLVADGLPKRGDGLPQSCRLPEPRRPRERFGLWWLVAAALGMVAGLALGLWGIGRQAP